MAYADIPDTDALLAASKALDHGTRLSYRVSGPAGLDVEMFRSEAASLHIPECQLYSVAGTQQYCTLRDALGVAMAGVKRGLSLVADMNGGGPASGVLDVMGECMAGTRPFTVHLHDPLGLSFLDTDGVATVAVPRTVEESREWGLPVVPASARLAPTPMPAGEVTGDAALAVVLPLLAAARNVMVVSGAGASTESGIMPYRAGTRQVKRAAAATPPRHALKTAVWTEFNPEDLAYDKFLASEETRVKAWQLYTMLYTDILLARPNPAHTVCARLHRMGKLGVVATQNIDGLYVAGGVPRDRVLELHGSGHGVECVACGAAYDRRTVHGDLVAGRVTAPACTVPGCGAPLKATTVSFGQALDAAVRESAEYHADTCDAMVVMGTGLLVQPVNTLPMRALQRGVPLVIVNLGATKYDDYAAAVVREPCGAFMARVATALAPEMGRLPCGARLRAVQAKAAAAAR